MRNMTKTSFITYKWEITTIDNLLEYGIIHKKRIPLFQNNYFIILIFLEQTKILLKKLNLLKMMILIENLELEIEILESQQKYSHSNSINIFIDQMLVRC